MFDTYISNLPEDRRIAFERIIELLHKHLPIGFEAQIQYKMPSFVVPHAIFPAGYHCDSKLALPFISVANQKNYIAIYHMGIYADEQLLEWFVNEYPKHCNHKLDMGKGCIRFKKINDIPFDLLKELFQKISVKDWINNYSKNLQK